MPKPLRSKVSSIQPDQFPYDKMLQECLKGELRIANAGLPQSQKSLSSLLKEEYPHVVCNDGSTHFFKKNELEYLASMLNSDEQDALPLPLLIEIGVNPAEADILILSRYEGKAEEKVISKTLNMPVTCEGGKIRIYRPQLALLRRKLKTTTVYVFSSKIVV